MTWRRALSVALALALALPLLLVVYDRPLQLMPWRKRSAQPEAAERRSNPGPALAALGRGKGDGDGDGVDLFKGEPLLGEEHIFFVETSCALDKPQHVPYDSESGLRLSPRGACAVEAAASAHPTHRVYLVHTCDVQRRSLAKGAAPAYALAALSIPNVRLWAVPYALHFVGTPLQGWLASGALRASRWPVVHASDVLRFLLLWKYGGTYLDLDVLEMTEEMCGGFRLLSTSTFYAIPWQNWNLFFTEESSEETMMMIGKNLAVHVWNALSHNTTVYTSSEQPYAQIARRVCPNVVAAVGDTM
ncbi:uncharacterized protein GBIM_02311 [Gryllus bimaculatus]|nr:uncharacterized protein GBIM_02311 [Gryllus bimaculatus]